MTKAIKIVIILLVIALLFGAFMLIRKLSNNFTTDIKTFYLVIDNEMLTDNSTSGITVLDKDIEVHTVGESISGKSDYTYKIVRNASAGSFTFYIDEERHTLADETDYTKGFEVTQEEGKLRIQSCGLSTVLNRVFGEGNVEFSELNNSTCYFTLVVSSEDGEHSISIDFAVAAYITDIQLDITEIEF